TDTREVTHRAARISGRVAGALRKYHRIAIRPDGRIEGSPVAERGDRSDQAGGQIVSRGLASSAIWKVRGVAITGAPGLFKDRLARRIDASVAPRERPTERVDRLH